MNRHPVEWNGQTFYLHDLTVKVKKLFCEWAVRWNGLNQIRTYSDFPNVLNPILASLPALIWWGDGPMSKLCAEALEHPDGNLFLNRLLFGDSAKMLSDTDLAALMHAKESEQNKANDKAREAEVEPPYPPVNDYFLALKLIKEESDPKANGPATGSAPKVATNISSAS